MVGPTEALRGRPDVPGRPDASGRPDNPGRLDGSGRSDGPGRTGEVRSDGSATPERPAVAAGERSAVAEREAPPAAAPDQPGRDRESGWRVAQQVWRDSGVDWEDESARWERDAPGRWDDVPDPYAPEAYSADAYSTALLARASAGDSYPLDSYPDDLHDVDDFDDIDDGLTDPHPTRPDLPVLRDPVDTRPGMGPWPVQPGEEPRPTRTVGRRVPENTDGRRDHDPAARDRDTAGRSAAIRTAATWNAEARSAGAGSAVADDAAAGGAASQAPPLPRRIRGAFPGVPSSAFAPASPFTPSPAFAAPRPFASTRGGAASALDSPRTSDEAPAFASPPLSAPVAPQLDRPLDRPLDRRAAHRPGESDELFRAWQGSVEEAVGRRGPRPGRRLGTPAGRRALGWQVAKIGVPAAVIVTVGAGALMMLTGRANEMLADRATSGTLSSGHPSGTATAAGKPAASAASGQAGAAAGLTLAGYPGQHGSVGVAALWSAGGTTMAVGYADAHPAVWRHASDGAWSLVSTAALAGLTGHFTAVADGPSGWIAVGSMNQNGTVGPAVFWSPDGVTWAPQTALTSLATGGAQFLGVAAGPGGYLVVGKDGGGNQARVALWWSADLKNWTNGESHGGAGSFAAAAVAVGDGFVAVGSENNCHAVWTSPDGRNWTAHDLAKPSGATSATLRSVAASQTGHVVAVGYATTGTGDIPLVVTSADGGATLHQVVLGAAGQQAQVSAVTSTGSGFVAAGQAGPANAQHAVQWTSADGLAWSPATPISAAGASQVTALTDTGTMVTATTQGNAGPTVFTIGQ